MADLYHTASSPTSNRKRPISPSADQEPHHKKQRRGDPYQITGGPQPATSRDEPGPIHNARGTTTRFNDETYIRDESLNFKYHVATQRGRNYQKTPKASQIGDDEVGYDDTIDVTTTRRCKVYMAGYWCHKGDWCDRLHRFPKEDGVVCKHFKRNECTRDSRSCWYLHPGKKVEIPAPSDNAQVLVQSVGDVLKYLRRKH